MRLTNEVIIATDELSYFQVPATHNNQGYVFDNVLVYLDDVDYWDQLIPGHSTLRSASLNPEDYVIATGSSLKKSEPCMCNMWWKEREYVENKRKAISKNKKENKKDCCKVYSKKEKLIKEFCSNFISKSLAEALKRAATLCTFKILSRL